jgi:hypothetical protein
MLGGLAFFSWLSVFCALFSFVNVLFLASVEMRSLTRGLQCGTINKGGIKVGQDYRVAKCSCSCVSAYLV